MSGPLFREQKREVPAGLLRGLRPKDIPAMTSFDQIAEGLVPIATGLRMMLDQEANAALRHCRLGRVSFR